MKTGITGASVGVLLMALLAGGAGGCVGKIGSADYLPGTTAVQNQTASITYSMLRLTNAEYLNTVQDLFPSATIPSVSLPDENAVDGYNNAASGQTPTSLLVQDYQAAAEAIVQAVSGNISTVVGCQPTSTAAEDTCAQTFINSFGKNAYRRPLTSDESTRLFNLYKTLRGADDFPTSMGLVIQVFLQSPYFVYRIESGASPSNGAAVPLTSYELASRMAYFLTDSMPDTELMQAADQNTLQDAATVESEARRLLGTQRAHDAVARFNYQWLKLAKLEGVTKDTNAFPNFTPALAQTLLDATVQYIDYAFWQQDSLSGLLTDNHAYVNDLLAPLYGLSPPGSSTLQLTQVDPTQRAGILTQVGMLSSLAGPDNDSPVQRGLLVLSKFLCQAPPPPPPGVNTTPPALDPSTPTTTRQRLQTQHAIGACGACHSGMDAIGFAFENYDALGQWRTTENGLPVDASSQLSGTDVDGTFTGAIALAQRLAKSDQVATCVSYEWLRYSLGLDTTQINLAAAKPVSQTFKASGDAFTELLVAIVTSDYFRSLQVAN
jgi:hypothetical protein